MAKGYWIAQSDVSDVAEYLKRKGAKTLVVSKGRYEVVEGAPRSRQLIQEFPDYETASAAIIRRSIKRYESSGRTPR